MKKHLVKKKIRLIKIEIIFISLYINVKPNFYNILEFMKKNEYLLVSVSKIKFKNNKILFMDAFFEPTK